MQISKRSVLHGIIVLITSAVFVLYLLGIAHHVSITEENTCEMTYMFEYPQYVRVTLDAEIENKFPRYALYAYGEGFVTERLRKTKFTGIPVLFIPGNAGSHKQARSMASISLRKSLKERTPFHFDYFTASLGQDYSALYGGVLMDQTIYISHCIQKILSLYQGKVKNVILVGHSMGGVIAKGAITMTSVNASAARILITLATPHEPVLILDRAFASYLNELHGHKDQLTQAGTSVISIGGGYKDFLVTSAQSIDRNAKINTLATSVPASWTSTDHLCILWCKQLLLVIVRALFDCVDTAQRPAKIFNDPERINQAFSYHLINRYHGKQLRTYQDQITFEKTGKWIDDIRPRYTWRARDYGHEFPKDETIFLMINLSQMMDDITIDTSELKARNWLFACSASNPQGFSRTCEWGWNLTNRTRIFPDPRHNLRRIADLNLNDIRKLKVTHLVVKIPPADRKDAVVNIDLHSKASRLINVHDNTFPNNLFRKRSLDSISLEKNSIRHIFNLTNIYDAVTMELQKVECSEPANRGSATIELVESWNPMTQIEHFTEIDNGPKTLKIQQKLGRTSESPQLKVTLDPTCSYIFRVNRAGIIERMSLRVRDRWPALYQMSIALLLLAVSMNINPNPNFQLGITIVLCIFLQSFVEFCVSTFILFGLAVYICCAVMFLGSVAHNIAARFLARAITFSVTWAEWLIGGINHLPLNATIIALSIIPATCGALAMFISVFFYFLKLTHMYQDYLEELLISSMRYYKLMKPEKDTENKESTRRKIFCNLLIFMLLCLAAVPAAPSVVTWAKNFSVEATLKNEDTVLLYSWVAMIICSTMNLVQIPCGSTPREKFLGYFLCLLSWVSIYLTSTGDFIYHQWWMPPIAAGAMILLSLNSILP